MTADSGQGDQGLMFPTHRVQIELITDTAPDVVAHPPGWRDSPDGVQYLARRDSVLVRDWHLDRVHAALTDHIGAEPQPQDLGGTATRLSWATETGVGVHDALDRLDQVVGRGVAAPDHLLYVCGVYPCAAVEQLPVPATARPYPPPVDPQTERAPRSGLGAGVRVLVLDTGLVEDAAVDHDWMNGVTGDVEDPTGPDGLLRQDGGHGTFVAGCVRVVAPLADVHVVDAAKELPVQNGTIGAVFESDLAQLLRAHLVAAPEDFAPVTVPDVLLLSVAGTTRNDVPPVALTAVYEDVIQHLKGLLVLAPAGNEGDARRNWPASFDWVVSVGALAANWRDRAPWSVHGRTVDVYAPGDRLVNAFARGDYTFAWEGPLRGQTRTFEGMAMWSGTSFSTPLVAGLVAARMSRTGQDSRRAWRSLRDLAEQQGLPGVGPVLFPGDA